MAGLLFGEPSSPTSSLFGSSRPTSSSGWHNHARLFFVGSGEAGPWVLAMLLVFVGSGAVGPWLSAAAFLRGTLAVPRGVATAGNRAGGF
jgi:hypothetical protein